MTIRTVTGACLALVLAGAGASPAQLPSAAKTVLPRTIVFDSSLETSSTRIALGELGANFPRDWAGYEALVLEVRASSPQRIHLEVHARGGATGAERFSRVLFHPYPGVWLRAAIPVSLLAQPPATGHDMAAVGNRSRVGYFLGLWGPFVPLDDVLAIGFEMEKPIGSPTLEVRSIRLERASPGDAVLDGLPLVDELGQYVHGSWPGKAGSVEDLRAAWREEERALGPGDPGLCRYGGFVGTKAEASGFFRVERRDGRWWFVDPDGHLFLSLGADVIRPEMVTPAAGREAFFRERPPEAVLPPPSRARDGDRGVSFLTWNLWRRFGEGWVSGWIDLTLRRMDAWGLNTVANWSDERLWEAKRKPYVIPLASWLTGVSYLGLPDVYSDAFAKEADERARRQCVPRRDDPWLLGYFPANEPPFPQKELQTVQLILAGPETATRAALRTWLADGDTEERRKEFIGEAFDRYVGITSAAVRRHDPNHLNLGMRSGGRPTAAEIRAARAFDVYSVNIYDDEVPAARVKEIAELTGKPVLIGEFHFGTPGRGMAASLVQVRDQEERGRAYRYYVENALAMPELVGTHWFQWADQPSTGRSDGENYNIGLVDVTDRPYPDLVRALVETHRRVLRLHSGELEPVRGRPRGDDRLAIPATDQDRHAVVFLGDSITQGWGGGLAAAFPGVKVANRGIGGDTTRGVLLRLEEDVLALDPAAVVLLIGTNDLEEGAAPEVVANNLALIVAALERHDPRMPIVLCQVFPSSAAKKRPADRIKALNALYLAAVKNDPQVTLLETWPLFAGPGGDALPDEFPDLLHPNERGYAKWAAALRPVFATLGFSETAEDEFRPEEGFSSLFNGRDLTGWGYRPTSEADKASAARWQATDPDAASWPFVTERVDFDGLKVSPDGRFAALGGRLVVKAPPEHRKIQQLWTTREFPEDFVLKLEFRATPNADSGVFLRGRQLQCRDYRLAGPYRELPGYRPQDWNEIVVTVRGGVAHCTCNGDVLEGALELPGSGPIGVEGDRGQVEYRRIRIKRLPR